jgi:hypothetical protein
MQILLVIFFLLICEIKINSAKCINLKKVDPKLQLIFFSKIFFSFFSNFMNFTPSMIEGSKSPYELIFIVVITIDIIYIFRLICIYTQKKITP